MDSRELGLFPLDLVLVPGERIPLHIFEPRYRQLFADCTLEDRPFVIVRADEAGRAEVGCAARFDELLQRTEDGRLNVVVRGLEPVAIGEETRGYAYLSAMCTSLADEAVTVDEGLSQHVAERFTLLATRLTGEARTPPVEGGVPLSYAVAGAVDIAPPIKQKLLETRDENQRLQSVARSLDLALRAAERMDMAAERAQTNGKVSHS